MAAGILYSHVSGFIVNGNIMNHKFERLRKACRVPYCTRVALAALLLCSFSVAAGCGDTQPAAKPDAAGWFGSPEELVRGFASALSAKDRTAMDRLRISREEYMSMVWPELPVSKIEQWKSQSGFVWSQHAAKSDSGLRKLLERFGGKTLEIRSVTFDKPAKEYATFKLHVRPLVEFADLPGKPDIDPVVGTIMERAGRFKFFSYSIND